MKIIKMNLKYVMVLTLSVLLGLSSCSKDSDMDLPNGDGEAVMTITINQPTVFKSTKATTNDYADVSAVDVYVYDTNGSLIMSKNFPAVTGGKVKVEGLTMGPKNVYVGVNLPEALANAIKTDGPTAAQTATVAQLIDADANMAMFSSAVKPVNLVAIDHADYVKENVVTVTVSRLLAQVTLKDGDNGIDGDIGIGKVTALEFNVSNVNSKLFPLPKKNGVKHEDPNYAIGDPTAYPKDEFTKGATYVELNGTNSVFTTENTSVGIKQTENTYVSVRGTFTPNVIHTYENSELKEGGTLTDGTFYKVIANAVVYFFADKTQAESYATSEGVTGDDAVMTYASGLTYYNVFLNPEGLVETGGSKDAVNPYDVMRNTKYTVKINSIKGLGDNEDKVDNEEIVKTTDLEVTIDVEAWKNVEQDSDLIGK